jgi:exonuclease III
MCLQETIKSEFSVGELAALSEGFNYEWVWTAAQGHSGGTLIGVKIDEILVIDKDSGEFYSSMKVKSRMDDFKWEIVNVYGPVQTERKSQFLEELSRKIAEMEDPFIMGGDFNFIRFPWEKSSGNVNQFWMNAFNEFIRDNGVKEMDRKGCRFTWSNKQSPPIMSVLDRVLTCTRWDQFYKKSFM